MGFHFAIDELANRLAECFLFLSEWQTHRGPPRRSVARPSHVRDPAGKHIVHQRHDLIERVVGDAGRLAFDQDAS